MTPTLEQETARAEQLSLNVRCLIDKMDRIHAALCPDLCGSWITRAEQAVKAAESIKANSIPPESIPSGIDALIRKSQTNKPI